MDAFSALLDGPRARDAFVLRALMAPPWSIRVQDEAPVSLVAMANGHAWVVPTAPDKSATRLGPGDTAIIRGPDHYVFADSPDTPPQVVIHPGQHCTTVDGEPLAEAMGLGVRTWGNDPHGPTELLIGTYQSAGEIGKRMLAALPALMVVPGEVTQSALIPALAAEITKDEPGQEVVLDRLLDLLLIAVLRAWFTQRETAPGWYRAHSDPAVGQVLRLVHHDPAHPWTVASLASAAGMSRAGLARRFTELVGEPPMSYVTNWRLSMAADLLREPEATIGSVARQVGYGTAFALSAAFKRERGVSPREYRLANSGA